MIHYSFLVVALSRPDSTLLKITRSHPLTCTPVIKPEILWWLRRVTLDLKLQYEERFGTELQVAETLLISLYLHLV